MDSKDGARDYIGIRKGLDRGRSLGELEAQILDIVWDLEAPVSTTQVFKVMYPRRELSYSTIMLTMAKLAKKGILVRERMGEKRTSPFVYTPEISREEMALALMNQVSLQVLRQPLHRGLLALTGKDSEGLIRELKRLIAAQAKKRLHSTAA